MLRRVVVVGASLAGLRAVETLRDRGFGGDLTLIGQEPHRPYDRPPLSKQVLQGTWEPEQTAFRKKEGYDGLGVDMHLGVAAESLDMTTRRVSTSDGSRFDYDALVIATGARLRKLPQARDLKGVYGLRDLNDAIALREALATAQRVAIVGAGFIGLEVAASCRARGLDVTVIETLPIPLSPIVGAPLGELVAALHRDHGVTLHTGRGVTEVQGDTRVEALLLSDGTRVEADVVVVGIGVIPNTEWLNGSGLTVENGVVCNGYGEAAPHVFAAGDVARMHNLWLGDDRRIEHWTNAVEQGVLVAENLLAGGGTRNVFSSVPYFWSDQYDRKLQMVGRTLPTDEMVIVDGSLQERKFTALFRRDDRLVACFALSQPRALIKYRKLLADNASWEQATAVS